MENISTIIMESVGKFGYFGVFVMMLLESTVFPLPSEIVMIPVGYLSFKGQMNIFLGVFVATIGNVVGSAINYYLAKFLGRKIIIKYGKYFLFTQKKLEYVERFFAKYGPISIFIGRFVPVARHFISIPAGLGNMNFAKMCIYTFAGSAMWNFILAALGYYFADNYHKIIHIIDNLKFPIIGFVAVTCVALFVFYKKGWIGKKKTY